MSHDHDHQQHDHHHNHQTHPKRPIHHNPIFWVAIGLMLVGMAAYVMTNDESELPGNPNQAPMPAAAE